MRELRGQARPARDVQRLLDGVDEVVAALADMAGVDAAAARGDLRERGELVLVRVASGRILEAGGEADGAGGHGLCDHRPHVGKLGRSRLPRVEAHRGEPDGAVRHERGDVQRLSLREEGVEVLLEGRPGEVDAPLVADADGHLLGELPVGRRGRAVAAVAGDKGRQPLPDAALRQAVDVEREVGVAVYVDEAGADRFSNSVNGPLGLDGGRFADVDDLPAVDDEVCGAGRRARAVDQAAVADD